MALTQPISPSSRQPFGAVDSSRLRFLQSMKNQQNGTTSTSLKRRLDTSEFLDTENMDPSSNSPAKRNRYSPNEDVSKTPTFTFTAPEQSITTHRHFQTPLARVKKASLPNSAPLRAPAGRSPKSRPAKAFSRRSIGSSSYTRVDPPSFTKPHAPRAPFSIADALHGTLNTSIRQTKTSPPDCGKQRLPKAWDFEIYADTEQDEMANLMEHSTCVLDISDDEDKSRNKDDRGKENIPPPDCVNRGTETDAAGVKDAFENLPAGRMVEMSDEPRSALGELDIAQFVHEENKNENILENVESTPSTHDDCQQEYSPSEENSPSATVQITPPSEPSFTDNAPQQHQPSHPTLASHAAISALISSSVPVTGPCLFNKEAIAPTDEEIKIWESGSVAGEAAEGDTTTIASVTSNNIAPP
ncbi:hypothetical protein AJ79_07939 [Helicocarpus griseus UAMH5409]|uniref:Uncharacterized protein n=1 Tax=Helicocarpus griseus UAMH5409 TaxID=1447875 RepID=A0A2B7WYA8_9EURO|nr:hypothetical protein AJ79_07939 [Helicocarpus griseus UAMH5409]